MTDSIDLTAAKVVELMREERFVMLSTVTEEGKIVSHPMTPQQVTDDGAVWFFIASSSEAADSVRRHPEANLSFANTDSWLSVSGSASLVDDPAKVAELWDARVEAYFPEGKQDPDLALLRVDGDSAQFWGVDGGKIVGAVRVLASKLLGTEGPGGTDTVEFR
ncbi:pyridoxamine 5'-phosphate oxidase family protein [Leucobacter weissii]|uniref:Pyridoxamine 5'-phosphate oxidase family protein n=1 Tax=Leucobacter weissii TaxID=1983706 RepID=A0A939MLF4_9MICO|nr:pyridoxamine 5'-phosphate oxidase family protein [Leucobacter weissii]MBO1902420.1 pyridoxamine 5'-phosphate oxidase family protein [Leucobacter weissii]